MMLHSVFIRFFPLVLLVHIVRAQDYCDSALCPIALKHIGCDNDGELSSDCPPIVQTEPLGPYWRDFIVTLHNSKRYLIADGRVEGYEPAVRMALMQWDEELARLAELNVKQCKPQYDACHNTKSFPYSGQNIHIYGWDKSITYVPMDDVIVFAVNTWFEEHKNATMANINNFSTPTPGKDYRSFTRLVQEKNTHVGCAIIRFIKGNKRWQLMTCNYAYNNVFNRAVYKSGPTASKCTTGTDRDYYTLCSVNEVYDV